MPKLFDMIEEQINIMLRFVLEDDETGQVHYNSWIPGPKWVRPIIYFFSLLIYFLVILMFGLFLWNQGLHVAFPSMVAHIGPGQAFQLANPYSQLITSLVALMFII